MSYQRPWRLEGSAIFQPPFASFFFPFEVPRFLIPPPPWRSTPGLHRRRVDGARAAGPRSTAAAPGWRTAADPGLPAAPATARDPARADLMPSERDVAEPISAV